MDEPKRVFFFFFLGAHYFVFGWTIGELGPYTIPSFYPIPTLTQHVQSNPLIPLIAPITTYVGRITGHAGAGPFDVVQDFFHIWVCLDRTYFAKIKNWKLKTL